MAEALTGKRLEILEFIGDSLREQGYPPSVREIGEAVGLTSSSTVHAHLAVLQREGYLRRDPTKPRAMEVRFDPSSRAAMAASPVRHVPLLGDVAAGTGVLASENVEELLPLPEDFTGSGSVFMLRVRGSVVYCGGLGSNEKLLRRAGKPLGAALRTKIVSVSFVLDFSSRFFRNNRHPADGILVFARPLHNRE